MSSREEIVSHIQSSRRVVIKIGSSLIAPSSPEGTSAVDRSMIEKLRDQVLFLRQLGKEVILVTSGAVAMGRTVLGETLPDYHPLTNPGLSRKQALAAVGQARLIALYGEVFAEARLPVSQILITARDFRDRNAYLNIGHTLTELLRLGIVPIINENDTVSTVELRFGDNDLLSAACTALLHADLLVLLTSVDGFLRDGKRLPHFDRIGADIIAGAGGPSGPGSGGMRTKIRAGELGLRTGFRVAILPGRHPQPVKALFAGEDIGTVIGQPGLADMSARKKWLLFVRTRGGIVVDEGAARALTERGSSLLAAGIREIRGSFGQGDVVEVLDARGQSLGRGITRSGARTLLQMLQARAKGEPFPIEDEIIHRNDLILDENPVA